MNKQCGFTLIELIATLIVISVLSVSIFSKFTDTDAIIAQSGRDDIVAALSFAQQVAMARGSSSNQVLFVSTDSTISVTERGAPLTFGSVSYPLDIPDGFSLTPQLALSFDKLGRTTGESFTLSKGSVSIQIDVSSSGYAK